MASEPPAPNLLAIPSKPHSPISYTLFPPINWPLATANYLIVFVNGLGLPAASWHPSIQLLRSSLQTCPRILTYDRYGQGLTTTRDPLDAQKERGHDFLDVANDLHEIILSIAVGVIDLPEEEAKNGFQVLLIGASIGANIVRLYVQHHPGNAAGIILLDSNIANVDYSTFWPDPDAPGFDEKSVVDDDCTLDQYRVARAKIGAMFDLSIKNAEGLDRSTGPELLPDANAPKLVGMGGKGPLLTVVGHDPETFAQMSLMMMGTPKSLSDKFTNPYWAKYNASLTQITDEDKCDGVVIAKWCGHFIQKDDPSFVATEIENMITKLGW